MKPRISIRSIFWLTALVAVLLGWSVDRRSLQKQAKDARRESAMRQEQAEALGDALRACTNSLKAATRTGSP